LGHKRTSERVQSMSPLPPKADIRERGRHVRFVPGADILRSRLLSAEEIVIEAEERRIALLNRQ